MEAVKSISLELQVGELTSLLGHNGAGTNSSLGFWRNLLHLQFHCIFYLRLQDALVMPKHGRSICVQAHAVFYLVFIVELKEKELNAFVGKSTLVGMMTGLLSPTAGDCLLLGKSIVKKKAEARRNLGYCPQRNVLYDRLTVREHLQLYGAIKGIQGGGFGKFTSLAVQQAIQVLSQSADWCLHSFLTVPRHLWRIIEFSMAGGEASVGFTIENAEAEPLVLV